MAFAQTTTSNQVTYNGFTWAFQQPVTWGYFVNGEPFVVAPRGSPVFLTGIEPTPRFIPSEQITVNVSGVETLITNRPWYAVTPTSGFTGPAIGITSNFVTTQLGLYINGSQLNPKYYGQVISDGSPALLYQPPSSDYSVDSRWHTTGINEAMPIDKQQLHSWTNLSASPKQLQSGDMLVSFNCSFYNNKAESLYAQAQNPSTPLSSARTIRFNSQAILTFVSSIPDENDFRPPLYWGFDGGTFGVPDPISRPIGRFKLSTVQPSKTSPFITLPTKDIFGRTMSDANNNPLTLNADSIALYNENIMANKLAWRYSPSTSYARTTPSKFSTIPWENMWGGSGPANDAQFSAIQSIHGGVSYYLMESLLSANALGIFCSYLSESARRKCLIQTIQYGIDMFGAVRAGYVDNRSGSGTRAAIILAGWLLNDSEMFNIDNLYPNQFKNNYAYIMSNADPKQWAKQVGSTAEFTARTRFSEVFYPRRLAGTWGDPSLSAIPNGYKYTDPGTTADVGIGWAYKNTGDNYEGIAVAVAGTRSSDVGIDVTAFLGTSKLHTTPHGYIGITLWGGGFGEPYAFPKTVSPLNQSRYGLSFPSNGSGVSPRSQSWKNIKMKIISGSGASDEVYRVVGCTDNVFLTTAVSSWTGQTRAEFWFDKNWTNGIPDSTSRVIFYPFDGNDIGTSVIRWGSQEAGIGGMFVLRDADLSVVSPSSLYNVVGSETDAGHSTVGVCNILRWYGLLYALGIRNPGSGILDNTLTQQLCDAIIFSAFSNEPFSYRLVSRTGSSNFDGNTGTHSFFTHAAPYVRDLSSMNGLSGIISQLWNRTIPR